MLMNIRHTWNDQLSRIIKNGDRLISLWQILEYADDGISNPFGVGVWIMCPFSAKIDVFIKNLSVIYLSGHAIIRNSQGSRRTVSFASCDKQQ